MTLLIALALLIFISALDDLYLEARLVLCHWKGNYILQLRILDT